MAFLQIFVSQQLLFLFSKHLDTMSNVTDCVSSQTDLCLKDFVWKYELQLTTDDKNNEITVHGYFNLYAKVKTQLDLSIKYDKENMKYIRFTCFEPCSPQHRAWFIPIKGLAFGKPRYLFPRNQGDTPLKLKNNHHIYVATSPG